VHPLPQCVTGLSLLWMHARPRPTSTRCPSPPPRQRFVQVAKGRSSVLEPLSGPGSFCGRIEKIAGQRRQSRSSGDGLGGDAIGPAAKCGWAGSRSGACLPSGKLPGRRRDLGAVSGFSVSAVCAIDARLVKGEPRQHSPVLQVMARCAVERNRYGGNESNCGPLPGVRDFQNGCRRHVTLSGGYSRAGRRCSRTARLADSASSWLNVLTSASRCRRRRVRSCSL